MEKTTDKQSTKKHLKELKLKSEKLELKLKMLKAKELEYKQQKYSSKFEEEEENLHGLYGTRSEPRKALSSFLRNQNKAEISLVSILDRKAAILIRICTTLISGLIVFQSYIEENVSLGGLISHILLGGMLLTLICAIIGTKPMGPILRRFFNRRITEHHSDLEENVFFIRNPNLSLDDYEEAMSKVIKSQNLQLGNQIRANYVLANNNGLKSKILDISYSIFLGTFIAIGFTYLYCNIYHQ